MLYRLELFNHNCNREEIERYVKDIVLPCFKDRGLRSYFFSSQVGLGVREFWFVHEAEKPLTDNLQYNLRYEEEEVKKVTDSLNQLTKDKLTYFIKDLEPDIEWISAPGRMYHIENFNSTVEREKLVEFFIKEAFPYLRSRGFNLKLFENRIMSGPAQFWFVTEIDSFSSIDKWSEMASGEPEGERIMAKLINIIDIPVANIIKELSIME